MVTVDWRWVHKYQCLRTFPLKFFYNEVKKTTTHTKKQDHKPHNQKQRGKRKLRQKKKKILVIRPELHNSVMFKILDIKIKKCQQSSENYLKRIKNFRIKIYRNWN